MHERRAYLLAKYREVPVRYMNSEPCALLLLQSQGILSKGVLMAGF